MSKALDDAYNDLAEEARSLRIEVTALQETVEQLRSIIKSEKAKVIDLPNLLRRAK
jgi:predicted  nucleic acid-binding Zn-ribbon protein